MRTGLGQRLSGHLDELHNLDVVRGRCDASLEEQGPEKGCNTSMKSQEASKRMSAMRLTCLMDRTCSALSVFERAVKTWRRSFGTSIESILAQRSLIATSGSVLMASL